MQLHRGGFKFEEKAGSQEGGPGNVTDLSGIHGVNSTVNAGRAPQGRMDAQSV